MPDTNAGPTSPSTPSPGIASASATAARIDVRTRVANADRRAGAARITASLIDAEGRVAASARSSLKLAGGATQEGALVLDVAVSFDRVDDGVLYIDITYSVRGLNDPRNLVFPFYVIPYDEPDGE